MILVVIIFFYFLGLFTAYKFKLGTPRLFRLYSLSFFIACCFMFSYEFLIQNILHISAYPELPGEPSNDGSGFHFGSVNLLKNGFVVNLLDPDFKFWAALWHYIIAGIYYVFGTNILYPKLFNIYLYSVCSIAFYRITLHLTQQKNKALLSYILFLLYLPLMFINCTLQKEMLIVFFSIMIVYNYMLYIENKSINAIYSILALLTLLFFTRYYYSIIIGLLFLLAYITNKDVKVSSKLILIVGLAVVAVFILNSGLLSLLGLDKDASGQGGRFSLATSKDTRMYSDSGSSLDTVLMFVKNPAPFLKMIVFGIFSFILQPVPFFIGYVDLKQASSHWEFVAHLHNFIYYPFIPASIYGIYYLIKNKQLKSLDYFILVYLTIIMIMVSLTFNEFLRYRIGVYPFMFIYAVRGLDHYQKWKFYILPFFILCLLLAFYGIVYKGFIN